MPFKPSTRSEAVPDNAPSTSSSVIAPLVASLIVFNCALVGSSVIKTVPVCVVTVPENAAAKSTAVPNNESLVTFKVILPEVSALMAFSFATLTLPVMVKSTVVISLNFVTF